jgi:hypothetical protein
MFQANQKHNYFYSNPKKRNSRKSYGSPGVLALVRVKLFFSGCFPVNNFSGLFFLTLALCLGWLSRPFFLEWLGYGQSS